MVTNRLGRPVVKQDFIAILREIPLFNIFKKKKSIFYELTRKKNLEAENIVSKKKIIKRKRGSNIPFLFPEILEHNFFLGTKKAPPKNGKPYS